MAMLWAPAGSEAPRASWKCPVPPATDEVCVYTDGHRVVAVNLMARPVVVQLRLKRVENLRLAYRHPFVEEVAAGSSRTLLKFGVVDAGIPHTLDYDWAWHPTE